MITSKEDWIWISLLLIWFVTYLCGASFYEHGWHFGGIYGSHHIHEWENYCRVWGWFLENKKTVGLILYFVRWMSVRCLRIPLMFHWIIESIFEVTFECLFYFILVRCLSCFEEGVVGIVNLKVWFNKILWIGHLMTDFFD